MSSLSSLLQTLSTLLVLLLGWVPLGDALTIDGGIIGQAFSDTIAGVEGDAAPTTAPAADDALAADLLDDEPLDGEPLDTPRDIEPLDEPLAPARDEESLDGEPLDAGILDDVLLDDEPLDAEILDDESLDDAILDDEVIDEEDLDVAVLPPDDAADPGSGRAGDGRSGGRRLEGGRSNAPPVDTGNTSGNVPDQTAGSTSGNAPDETPGSTAGNTPGDSGQPEASDRGQGAVIAGTGSIPAQLEGCHVGAVAGRGFVGVGCGEQNVIAGHAPIGSDPANGGDLGIDPGTTAEGASQRAGRQRGDDQVDLELSADGGEPAERRGAGARSGNDRRRNADQAADAGVLADEPTADAGASAAGANPVAAEPASGPAIVAPAGGDLGSLSVEPELVNGSRYDDPVLRWLPELEAAAAETGLPVALLAAVMKVTSNGDPGLIFPDGGVGLLKVPTSEFTSRGLEPARWFDPATNILVGAEELAPMFGLAGDPKLALMTYLAGYCDPFAACTHDYVENALAWFNFYGRALADASQGELGPLKRFRPAAFSPTAIASLPGLESPPTLAGDAAEGGARSQPQRTQDRQRVAAGAEVPVVTDGHRPDRSKQRGDKQERDR